MKYEYKFKYKFDPNSRRISFLEPMLIINVRDNFLLLQKYEFSCESELQNVTKTWLKVWETTQCIKIKYFWERFVQST